MDAFWISRLSLDAHIFSLMVSALVSALFWVVLLDPVPLDDQSRNSGVVLLSYSCGSAFVSLYSLAFEITRVYTISMANLVDYGDMHLCCH